VGESSGALDERVSELIQGGRAKGGFALALAKADATVDMVKEILDSSDSKVLVFTESVAAAKAIAEKLGAEAILHYGQQSDDKREAAKREFQRDGSPKRVFVSTRPSLAVGATLTAADKVVFNDLPWTAADVRQAEDRAHRVGQKNAVNVYWNVAEDNNFDENVAAILRRKYDLSAKINEGRQLSPEEKAWMDKPITMSEVMDRIKGKPSGPPEPKIEKSARAQLRDMTRALIKAAR
jgi:SNF2 family DNA or RNA helicase